MKIDKIDLDAITPEDLLKYMHRYPKHVSVCRTPGLCLMTQFFRKKLRLKVAKYHVRVDRMRLKVDDHTYWMPYWMDRVVAAVDFVRIRENSKVSNKELLDNPIFMFESGLGEVNAQKR